MYDLWLHTLTSCLPWDTKLNLWLTRVSNKQSKMDPSSKGFYSSRKRLSPICPVDATVPYPTVRDNHLRPLFVLRNGRMLICPFSILLTDVLGNLCLKQREFNTHNFRIRAASSAKAIRRNELVGTDPNIIARYLRSLTIKPLPHLSFHC